MGCEVVNLEGYHMGVVTEILETGSNDVLRVKANKKDAYGKQGDSFLLWMSNLLLQSTCIPK